MTVILQPKILMVSETTFVWAISRQAISGERVHYTIKTKQNTKLFLLKELTRIIKFSFLEVFFCFDKLISWLKPGKELTKSSLSPILYFDLSSKLSTDLFYALIAYLYFVDLLENDVYNSWLLVYFVMLLNHMNNHPVILKVK